MGTLLKSTVSVVDNDLEESFWKQVAFLLQQVEAYYREFKLKKPVWEKITPIATRYLVARAFLHAVDHHTVRCASPYNALESDVPGELERVVQKGGPEVLDEEVQQYVSELEELNSVYRELRPLVVELLRVTPVQLEEQFHSEVIRDIQAHVEQLSGKAPTRTSVDRLDSAHQLAEECRTESSDSDDNDDQNVLPSPVVYDAVTQFGASLNASDASLEESLQNSKLVDFREMVSSLENYPKLLMSKTDKLGCEF